MDFPRGRIESPISALKAVNHGVWWAIFWAADPIRPITFLNITFAKKIAKEVADRIFEEHKTLRGGVRDKSCFFGH